MQRIQLSLFASTAAMALAGCSTEEVSPESGESGVETQQNEASGEVAGAGRESDDSAPAGQNDIPEGNTDFGDAGPDRGIDSLAMSVQGAWTSTQDAKYQIQFEGPTLRSFYDGKLTDESRILWQNGCDGRPGSEPAFVEIDNSTGQKGMCRYLVNVDFESETLVWRGENAVRDNQFVASNTPLPNIEPTRDEATQPTSSRTETSAGRSVQCELVYDVLSYEGPCVFRQFGGDGSFRVTKPDGSEFFQNEDGKAGRVVEIAVTGSGRGEMSVDGVFWVQVIRDNSNRACWVTVPSIPKAATVCAS